MARRFRGESTCKVDPKGRFFLPSAFRRAVEDGDPNFTPGGRPELVIAYGDERQEFLEGFTIAAMDVLDDKISRLLDSDLKNDLLEAYSAQLSPTEVDPEGRVLIPPKAREKLGGETDVVLVAWGDVFRIWAKSTYDAHKQRRQTERVDRPAINLREALDAKLAQMDAKG